MISVYCWFVILKFYYFLQLLRVKFGSVLVLHTPIIKYIFEIHLSKLYTAGDKNGKENMEGLKCSTQHLCSYPVVYVGTLLDNLPVKGLIS